MGSQRYTSDLTDAEWSVLEPYVPKARSDAIHGGRPGIYSKRAVVEGILYIKTTGCQWKNLPTDFPPYPTVYYYFNTWSKQGIWEEINRILREQVRIANGREREPSAALGNVNLRRSAIRKVFIIIERKFVLIYAQFRSYRGRT